MGIEELDEIKIPEIEEKPRKKWKKTAVIMAACIMALAVAVVVLVVKINSAPERALRNGLRNLAAEMQERQELWNAAAESTGKGSGSSKTTVILNATAKELPVTLGIDTMLLKDDKERQLAASTQLSVMNRQLAEVNLYGNEDVIMLHLPVLWEQNFAFDTGRIDEQYNASLLAEKWGKLENQKIVIDFFPDEELLSWKELMIRCREILEGIFDKEKKALENFPEIAIEKLEEDVILEQRQCRQYRILLSGIEAAGLPAEVMLLAAVDENDRIAQLSLEEALAFEDAELTGKILFLGGGDASETARSIDDIFVDLQIEIPLDSFPIDTSLLSAFGNQIAEELTEESIVIQIDAEIVYDENDTSVTVNLDELTASVDRIGTFQVTGEVTVEPLREEAEPPVGETLRIFEITQEEYDDLERQLQQKLLRWSIIGQLLPW